MSKSSFFKRLINETGFSILQTILLTVVSNYFLPVLMKLFKFKLTLYKQIIIYLLCISVVLGLCYWIYTLITKKNNYAKEFHSVSTIQTSTNDFDLDPAKNAIEKKKKIKKNNNFNSKSLSYKPNNIINKFSLSTDLLSSTK
jgi:hypothetical protein